MVWPVCNSKSQRILCVSFSWTDSDLCIFCSMVKFQFFPQLLLLLLLLLYSFFTLVLPGAFYRNPSDSRSRNNSSEYSRRSEQLYGLSSSSDLQFSHFLFRILGHRTKCSHYDGITVTFICHKFFSSLTRFIYLSSFSLSFYFTPWSSGTAKFTRYVHFFLLTTIWSGLLALIGSSSIFQNPKEFLLDSDLWIYHLSL